MRYGRSSIDDEKNSVSSIEHDRLTSAAPREEEQAFDRAIRPKTLEDYVGQPSVKQQMNIFITAATRRGEALDHVLIFGPPGLGKPRLHTSSPTR